MAGIVRYRINDLGLLRTTIIKTMKSKDNKYQTYSGSNIDSFIYQSTFNFCKMYRNRNAHKLKAFLTLFEEFIT